MSTILNTEGSRLEIPEPLHKDFRCAIAVAHWNRNITGPLLQGALSVLGQAGVADDHIAVHEVPGTVELVYAAARLARTSRYDAVIVIGCVIRGDTPHFDYVCQIAAAGTARINADGHTPVIFGVLTVDNLQQALDRAGGILGNKGAEAAVAAITMANFTCQTGEADSL